MKSYDKTLTRLILILTKLTNNEKPTTKDLAKEFNVGIRTIQRDLYERLIYFPIEKNTKGQLRFIEGFTLDRCSLDNDEMLLVYLAMSQVKTMSHNFENKIDHLFSKLLNPSFNSPYFIKPNSYEQIDLNSTLLKSIEDSIANFQYAKIELLHKSVKVKPYKIVCLDGIWYLFAKDTNDDKIKTYKLSQIISFEILNEKFELQINIDEILSHVHSGWFEDGNSFKVFVQISSTATHYFQSKQVLPTQQIIEEKTDGSIIVQFEVSHEEDIDNIIKAWLPDIKVLEPIEYKKKLEKELQTYLEI